MSTETIHLIGAGGQAAVVIDALLAGGTNAQSIAVWTQDPPASGAMILGVSVRQLVDLDQIAGQPVHVAIGHNATRQCLVYDLTARGARPYSIIHPSATISVHAVVGMGTFVAAGAIVAPRATIGLGAILNHNAVVDHDCVLGDFVHVAPGATLGGGVTLADTVLIGAGANILPLRKVGTSTVVGAGAVVTADIGDHLVYTGVPAAALAKRRQ